LLQRWSDVFLVNYRPVKGPMPSQKDLYWGPCAQVRIPIRTAFFLAWVTATMIWFPSDSSNSLIPCGKNTEDYHATPSWLLRLSCMINRILAFSARAQICGDEMGSLNSTSFAWKKDKMQTVFCVLQFFGLIYLSQQCWTKTLARWNMEGLLMRWSCETLSSL